MLLLGLPIRCPSRSGVVAAAKRRRKHPPPWYPSWYQAELDQQRAADRDAAVEHARQNDPSSSAYWLERGYDEVPDDWFNRFVIECGEPVDAELAAESAEFRMPWADTSFWSGVSIVTWRSAGLLGTRRARSTKLHLSMQRDDPITGAHEIMKQASWWLDDREREMYAHDDKETFQRRWLPNFIDWLEEDKTNAECVAEMIAKGWLDDDKDEP